MGFLQWLPVTGSYSRTGSWRPTGTRSLRMEASVNLLNSQKSQPEKSEAPTYNLRLRAPAFGDLG